MVYRKNFVMASLSHVLTFVLLIISFIVPWVQKPRGSVVRVLGKKFKLVRWSSLFVGPWLRVSFGAKLVHTYSEWAYIPTF